MPRCRNKYLAKLWFAYREQFDSWQRLRPAKYTLIRAFFGAETRTKVSSQHAVHITRSKVVGTR